MKNLVIISYSYPPSNAPAALRPYALAKYIDKSMYNVTVITCSNQDSSLGTNSRFDETLQEVKLIKIKSPVGGQAAGFREAAMAGQTRKSIKQTVKKMVFNLIRLFIVPDKGIFWAYNVRRFLRSNQDIVKNADIVYTTSPLFSNHILGRFIKKKNSAVKWLVDVRDFHYVEYHAQRKGVLRWYHKFMEDRFFKEADRITFISSAMQKVYESYYTTYRDKMRHVHNGFDMEEFQSFVIQPTQNKPLTIFYAGSFYAGIRSPRPLLALLDKCFAAGLVSTEEVVINIAGNFEDSLTEEVKHYHSFRCIRFLGKLPRTAVLELMTSSDLLWLIVGNKITHYTGVPVKFFEYLAARRPIINFAPSASEPTKIISKYGLGWSVDYTEADLTKALPKFEEIITLYRNGKLKQPLPAQSIAVFDRKSQAKEFEEILNF